MRALVTGGCGFIGSALVRHLVDSGDHVLNIDKLTYAGDERTVAAISCNPLYHFAKLDICDRSSVQTAIVEFQPDVVFHLAAESHVDRSIDAPGQFIDTNVVGTYALLQSTLAYYRRLAGEAAARFRFVHVSTDEVFGSLGSDGHFNEDSAYRPNSPYSASKAAADHLARSWHATYQLPVIISNCSNNYGPFQNREKLIPTIIRKALLGQAIPIYGKGDNVRDWLYVDNHVAALCAVRSSGRIGESYVFGGRSEINNLDLARLICERLDARCPRPDGKTCADQIRFVADRPGHDHRYAVDPSKAQRDLGWVPHTTLSNGIDLTIDWYLGNRHWISEPIETNDRLGLSIDMGQR